jgi:hypothetical protein
LALPGWQQVLQQSLKFYFTYSLFCSSFRLLRADSEELTSRLRGQKKRGYHLPGITSFILHFSNYEKITTGFLHIAVTSTDKCPV